MPLKGIILIFVIAIMIALHYHEEIYEWFASEISDVDYTDNEENQEE